MGASDAQLKQAAKLQQRARELFEGIRLCITDLPNAQKFAVCLAVLVQQLAAIKELDDKGDSSSLLLMMMLVSRMAHYANLGAEKLDKALREARTAIDAQDSVDLREFRLILLTIIDQTLAAQDVAKQLNRQ